MSLRGRFKASHEARLKAKRDQLSRDAYVREEGIREGIKTTIECIGSVGVSRKDDRLPCRMRWESIGKIEKFWKKMKALTFRV